MFLFDLINLALNAAGPGSCNPADCPAGAFNSITAAFATQGYFKQADILEYFSSDGPFGALAALVYALSAFGGVVSMAMGAPPKNYIWFFIGPGLYYFLIDSHLPARGVRWMDMNGAITAQDNTEVWRMSQAGLHNNGYVIKHGIQVTGKAPPSQPAQVSNLFLWIDYLSSSLVEMLIPLSGIYDLRPATGDGYIDRTPSPKYSGQPRNWSILTDLKWEKINDITAVQLSSGDLREAFTTFLQSPCGDAFADQIDDGKWIAATKGEGKNIPLTVFKDQNTNNTAVAAGLLAKNLANHSVPMPQSVVNLLKSGIKSYYNSSFLMSAPMLGAYLQQIDHQSYDGGINCDQFLRIIMHGFKYQAIHTFSQMMDDAPGEFSDDPDAVIYNLLYGWGIGNLPYIGPGGAPPDHERRNQYLINLIFVYLMRNELAITPKPKDTSSSSSKLIQSYVDTHVRTVGSVTKYAEVYSWAKMMPYFQGVMMYVLALAYPFCALMVLVPGWHKIIVTWMTFWIWTKSWDVGFAVVKTIERSIWSMLGNDPEGQSVNTIILGLYSFMPFTGGCATGGAALANCEVPKVDFRGPHGGLDSMVNTFQALGVALGLAGNLKLDLTNSYYIYIMAALYFAVPGVTGQIILGAKAGAANLVGGMIQGLGDKASGAAGTGYQSNLAGHIQANAQTVGQQAYIKGAGGIMVDALGHGNVGHMYQADSGHAQTKSQNAQAKAGAAERRLQSAQTALSLPDAGGSQAAAMFGIGSAIDAVAAAHGMPSFTEEYNKAGAGAPQGRPGIGAGGAPQRGNSGRSSGHAPAGASPAGAPAGAGWIRPFNNIGQSALNNSDRIAATASAYAKNSIAQPAYDLANEIAAQNNDRGIQAYAAGQQSQRAQEHGRRLQGYGNFAGESAAHRASTQMHAQMGAFASVAGGLMGGSLVRPKPTANQDSAMSGILNTYAGDGQGGRRVVRDGQNAAGFFAAGAGFDQHVGMHVQDLQSSVGGDAVRAQYGGGFDGPLDAIQHGVGVASNNKSNVRSNNNR